MKLKFLSACSALSLLVNVDVDARMNVAMQQPKLPGRLSEIGKANYGLGTRNKEVNSKVVARSNPSGVVTVTRRGSSINNQDNGLGFDKLEIASANKTSRSNVSTAKVTNDAFQPKIINKGKNTEDVAITDTIKALYKQKAQLEKKINRKSIAISDLTSEKKQFETKKNAREEELSSLRQERNRILRRLKLLNERVIPPKVIDLLTADAKAKRDAEVNRVEALVNISNKFLNGAINAGNSLKEFYTYSILQTIDDFKVLRKCLQDGISLSVPLAYKAKAYASILKDIFGKSGNNSPVAKTEKDFFETFLKNVKEEKGLGYLIDLTKRNLNAQLKSVKSKTEKLLKSIDSINDSIKGCEGLIKGLNDSKNSATWNLNGVNSSLRTLKQALINNKKLARKDVLDSFRVGFCNGASENDKRKSSDVVKLGRNIEKQQKIFEKFEQKSRKIQNKYSSINQKISELNKEKAEKVRKLSQIIYPQFGNLADPNGTFNNLFGYKHADYVKALFLQIKNRLESEVRKEDRSLAKLGNKREKVALAFFGNNVKLRGIYKNKVSFQSNLANKDAKLFPEANLPRLTGTVKISNPLVITKPVVKTRVKAVKKAPANVTEKISVKSTAPVVQQAAKRTAPAARTPVKPAASKASVAQQAAKRTAPAARTPVRPAASKAQVAQQASKRTAPAARTPAKNAAPVKKAANVSLRNLTLNEKKALANKRVNKLVASFNVDEIAVKAQKELTQRIRSNVFALSKEIKAIERAYKEAKSAKTKKIKFRGEIRTVRSLASELRGKRGLVNFWKIQKNFSENNYWFQKTGYESMVDDINFFANKVKSLRQKLNSIVMSKYLDESKKIDRETRSLAFELRVAWCLNRDRLDNFGKIFGSADNVQEKAGRVLFVGKHAYRE